MVLDTEKYLDAVCHMLAQGQRGVPVPVKGTSMMPFLRNGDMVYLDPMDSPVNAGDILLYRRKSGQYVLHRVYKCRKDGSFLLLGDNQVTPEPVQPEQLRGRVGYVQIRGQRFGPEDKRWWLFARYWRHLRPLRPLIGKVNQLLRK